MSEKFDEMYQEYLTERLNLVFSNPKDSHNDSDKENEPNIVMRDGKYYLVGSDGKLLNQNGYDSIIPFSNGYSIIEHKNKYNIIDKNGNLTNKEWFDGIRTFDLGITVIYKKAPHYEAKYGSMMPYKFDVIDIMTGKRIFNKWLKIYPDIRIYNRSFGKISFEGFREVYYFCIKKDLNNCKVKKVVGGYYCFNDQEKFKTKYEPIKIYDTRYVLCLDQQKAYLFDRKSRKNKELGTVEDIDIDGDFIIDKKNNIVLFIYEGQLHEITEYYHDKLENKRFIINKKVDILSKEDFFIKQEEEIKKQAAKARKEEELARKRAQQTDEERRLLALHEREKLEAKKHEISKIEAIRSIMKGIEKIEEYEKKNNKRERVTVSNLFIDVNGHKEFNPLYLNVPLLKHIDLGFMSFKNVKISGIDFRGCNIDLNPQEVYAKDISGCNFEGVYFSPLVDFIGVDIRGTKFSQDNNPLTLDFINGTIKYAIYDETTTYNGKPLTEIFGPCEKRKKQGK